MARSFSILGRLPARTPLVGRTAELNFLKARVDAVVAGARVGCFW